MTHISYVIFLLVYIPYSIGMLEKQPQQSNIDKEIKKKEKASDNETSVIILTVKKDSTANDSKQNKPNIIKIDNIIPDVESGALKRGVFIFVGFGMIFIIYLAVKTYRNKRPNLIIRKYGVRGRRTDVEMKPLPLLDEEDDETVFDLGNINRK